MLHGKIRSPVKSYNLLKYLGEDLSECNSVDSRKSVCYKVAAHEMTKTLKDVHFLLALHETESLVGMDFLCGGVTPRHSSQAYH